MRYVVTAVASRIKGVKYLIEHIPELEVVWDRVQDPMETFLRASEHTGDDPVIRLEDDAILTVGFLEKASRVIEAHPDNVAQFFSRSKYDVSLGSRWKSGRSYLCNVGYYMPEGMMRRILEHYWSDNWDRGKHRNGTDTLIGHALGHMKHRYWVEVPSLVDHGHIKSAIDPRRSTKRQSTTFVEPELRNYPYA